MPFPDYVGRKPKIIFFSDFDGTISDKDSCDWLIENEGYGKSRMQEAFQAVYHGERTYRDISQEQFDSIATPFDKCMEKVMANIDIDEHFITFYKWCIEMSIALIILSGRLTPIIKALLARAVGYEPDGVEIIANEVVVRDDFESINESDGAWKVQFRDDSDYGHDKSRASRPYAEHKTAMPDSEVPILLYAGDGVSDLSAARETDLLLAKQGQDLVTYCKKHKVPFLEFRDWSQILAITQDLYYGKQPVDQVIERSQFASSV